jgi:hypothetical protein
MGKSQNPVPWLPCHLLAATRSSMGPRLTIRGGGDSQKQFLFPVAHGPKLALRGVTPHLVTDMRMYSHATVGEFTRLWESNDGAHMSRVRYII